MFIVQNMVQYDLLKRVEQTFVKDIIKRSTTHEEIFLTSIDLKAKTVYDIGGYYGLLTIVFSKLTGPGMAKSLFLNQMKITTLKY